MALTIGAELTRRLVRLFDIVAKPDWTRFEEELTYDNAKVAHALILSGQCSGQESVCDRGLSGVAMADRRANLAVWPFATHRKQRVL